MLMIRAALLLALAAAGLWATLPVALKVALEALDPWTLTWFRFLAAALLMTVWLLWRGRLGAFRALSPRAWTLLTVATAMLAVATLRVPARRSLSRLTQPMLSSLPMTNANPLILPQGLPMTASLRRLRRAAIICMTLFAATPTALQAQEVNLYTTREPGLIQPLIDAFTKSTGIKVNSIFIKDGLAERVAAGGVSVERDRILDHEVRPHGQRALVP